MKTVLTALAIGILKISLTGWAFMLTVGVIHAEWIPMLPTIGYGDAVLITMLIGLVAALMTWDTSSE